MIRTGTSSLNDIHLDQSGHTVLLNVEPVVHSAMKEGGSMDNRIESKNGEIRVINYDHEFNEQDEDQEELQSSSESGDEMHEESLSKASSTEIPTVLNSKCKK